MILATGATPRALGVAGEQEADRPRRQLLRFLRRHVYRGKTVVIVGGGNTAAADAILLSRICEKVFVVHRRDTLRATKIYHEPLMKAENIAFCWNSTVSELLHGDKLTGVKVRNIQTGEETEISCDGLFVHWPGAGVGIGQGQLELDGAGYIVADESANQPARRVCRGRCAHKGVPAGGHRCGRRRYGSLLRGRISDRDQAGTGGRRA